jgi:hypothetical protein
MEAIQPVRIGLPEVPKDSEKKKQKPACMVNCSLKAQEQC